MQNYPVPHRKYLDKDGGEDRTYSGFSYFMDGSRRTYKIGDMVLEGKKIYLVVVARVRAGCTERDRQKKLHTQIGAELLKLKYGQRTPVFLKENSKHRKFGCWYLRIRSKNKVSGPLEGIIKIEKMAILEEEEGLDSSVVDNLSLWLLNEGSPTCYGRDERWASHLYSVYLTETLIKSSFESDLVFINNFKRNFR